MADKIAYEPNTVYLVRLTRVAMFSGAKLLPRYEHEMTGTALTTVVETEGEDVVEYAKPI